MFWHEWSQVWAGLAQPQPWPVTGEGDSASCPPQRSALAIRLNTVRNEDISSAVRLLLPVSSADIQSASQSCVFCIDCNCLDHNNKSGSLYKLSSQAFTPTGAQLGMYKLDEAGM